MCQPKRQDEIIRPPTPIMEPLMEPPPTPWFWDTHLLSLYIFKIMIFMQMKNILQRLYFFYPWALHLFYRGDYSRASWFILPEIGLFIFCIYLNKVMNILIKE